ncbi:hypothetical protein [Sphingomonas montana]|uniref:hypothetical protein n=1 Tax=Sphingomonas montana TaxID=1843236 RepID=UPI0009F99896|nr:hypothetical protein [Sphingomonas montana]
MTNDLMPLLRRAVLDWDRVDPDTEGTFPAIKMAALRGMGATTAFADVTPGAQTAALAEALRLVGGADLGLGRIFEGHVNAAQLVNAYGNAEQRTMLADDLAAGMIFGVWATGPVPEMELVADAQNQGGGWRLVGAKSFATGAGHLDRVLITVRDGQGAKRLVFVDLRGAGGRADLSGWTVRGMKGTGSGAFDFDGMLVPDAALIGGGDVYETEPRFSGGAWRFTAVQLGGVVALLRHYRNHLVSAKKDGDAIQRARFGVCVVAVRSAALWVDRAAQAAERGDADAVPLVLMTRGVVEEAGLATMEAAARAVGTASFFTGNRIDRITRDLGLYLRQPVPDQARDRAAAAWIERDCWGDDRWW